VLTLEEALRKMTSLAAETFHLNHRGRIRPGYAADLVVFDPDQIEDNATYAAPLNPPSGIAFVFVNGVIALDHGKTTDKNAGRPITRMN
jgi:N-acyl-D-amino-acid deacylase